MYAISSIHISACREVVSATWIHDLLVVMKKPYSCIKAHHFITYFLFKKLIFTDKKKIFVYIGTYEFQYMYLEVRLVVSYYKMWVVELLESISVSSLIQIFWTPMVIWIWHFIPWGDKASSNMAHVRLQTWSFSFRDSRLKLVNRRSNLDELVFSSFTRSLK